MRHIIYIIATLLLSTSAFAQNYKVLERSEKKAPSWVGCSGEGFICVSATDADMEEARKACMRSVKEEIIQSIAVNVVSESKIYMQGKESNDVNEFVNEFMSNSTTQAATLPFITGISISKASATYWEKLQDKSTKHISYMVAVKYPLSASEIATYRKEFLELDNRMMKQTEELEAGIVNVSSVKDIDNGIAKAEEMVSYFFDSRRKKWAESILAQYQRIPTRLSVHGKAGRDDSYTVWIELDGNKITPSGNPKLTSNCASDLKFKRDGQDYIVTYDTADCLDDEQNSIEVSFKIKGRTIREKFIIE